MLRKLELEEIEMIQDEEAYKSWIKIATKTFYKYVHELELARRRNTETIENDQQALDESYSFSIF